MHTFIFSVRKGVTIEDVDTYPYINILLQLKIDVISFIRLTVRVDNKSL